MKVWRSDPDVAAVVEVAAAAVEVATATLILSSVCCIEVRSLLRTFALLLKWLLLLLLR